MTLEKSKYDRSAHKWTPEEDAELARALEEGLSHQSVAIRLTTTFNRPFTKDAVESRCRRLRLRRQDTPKAAARAPVAAAPSDTELDIPITWDEGDVQTPVAADPPSAARPSDPVQRSEERDRYAKQQEQIRRLVDQLKEAKARQKFLDAMAAFHEPPRIMARERSGVREMTAVVLASDWHVEETVDPVSVMGRNEYNLEVAARRIERFFNAIIWRFEHERASGRIALRDLVLWLGGDLITGYIHEELLESNALSPTETIRWLLPKLRDGIATLLERLSLERIVLPCSYGNHGRTTPKTRVSTGYANSFEWLMYCSLADEFRKDPRVVFEITNSAHQYVQVYDFVLHFHHGDDVKYQGGVGGIGIPLLKAVPMWDLVKSAHVHNIGHWHQLLDFGNAVVNGSLIGFSPYSLRIRAKFERPRQVLYLIDSKRGKADGVRHLWVDDGAERSEAA